MALLARRRSQEQNKNERKTMKLIEPWPNNLYELRN
jgi:hypothetical protein